MMAVFDSAANGWIAQLLACTGRSLVLAGIAAAGLSVVRARATSLRLFVWTSVLYASAALPLLAWLLPPVTIPAPEFVRHRITKTELGTPGSPMVASPRVPVMPVSDVHAGKVAVGRPATPDTPWTSNRIRVSSVNAASAPGIISAFRWEEAAVLIYLLITVFFLFRFAAGVVLSRKLIQKSRIIPELTAKVAAETRYDAPQLAASECITVPLTVGALRPTILLPADWRQWETDKLEAVLAHELSHVERRDPLTQHIALLYRAIFWMNPLAWWLNRHLAALAEEASDEAALSRGADQSQYARTLLGFFESLQTAPGRIRWQGVSMARTGEAERRLERILAWKGTVPMHLKKSIAIAILVLALPVVYLAASVRPGQAAPAAPSASAPQPPASPAARPGAPVGGVSAVAPSGGVSSAAPVSGVPSVAPVAPVSAAVAPAAEASEGSGQHHSRRNGFSYGYGFDDEERFVIVSGKTDAFTMSGSVQDARHVEKLKNQIPGDFIWFQRDEKSYIIRDQATIDRARALWAPQDELGRKQEELGKQQEALGKQQEELGKKMEEVRVNLPDITAELDRLKAKLQKLGSSATMEQVGDLQSEIGDLQSKIGDIQSKAGEQQGKLGEEQGKLGEEQGKLGEQQGELGRQQAELAEKATREMKELLDNAIKNGTAKPEDEIVKTPTL